MALQDFDFPYHTVETKNPESGYRGQFGNSYVFTATPTDPDQRVFTLEFPTMKFFTDSEGAIDNAINPQYNMMTFIEFYQAHKLHTSFTYDHPVHGSMECKFFQPLVEPKGIPGGDGAVKEFTIQIVEVP